MLRAHLTGVLSVGEVRGMRSPQGQLSPDPPGKGSPGHGARVLPPGPGSGRRCAPKLGLKPRAPLSPGRKRGGREHFLLCSRNQRRRHCIHVPLGVSGPGAKGQPLPGRAARRQARGGRPGLPSSFSPLGRALRPARLPGLRGERLRFLPGRAQLATPALRQLPAGCPPPPPLSPRARRALRFQVLRGSTFPEHSFLSRF